MDFVLFLLVLPALTGAMVTLILARRRHGLLLAGLVGLAIAASLYWLAWLSSPTTPQQGESDAEMFLGRWWEPRWVSFLLEIGLVGWGIGMLAGRLVAASTRAE
jgi:hypothetical protein